MEYYGILFKEDNLNEITNSYHKIYLTNVSAVYKHLLLSNIGQGDTYWTSNRE